LADFSGDPTDPLPVNSDRECIDVIPGEIDDEMWRFAAGLNLRVANTLADDGSQMAVSLRFRTIKDFEADSVIAQIPALAQLHGTRTILHDLADQISQDTPIAFLIKTIEGMINSFSVNFDPYRSVSTDTHRRTIGLDHIILQNRSRHTKSSNESFPKFLR
jgi:predicted component of type VI protein secretion system